MRSFFPALDCERPSPAVARRSGAGLPATLLAATLLVATPAAAEPAVALEAVVVGDSIGVGIATAVGLKNRARISFSIRRSNMAQMLAAVPAGAVAVLSAGLNDVGDPIEHLAPSLGRAIEAARKSGRQIVWLGPPCTFDKWSARTRELDQHLQQRLAGSGITYVSLVDDWICKRENRTRDGVHFHHAGYLYLWEKIRRDAPVLASVKVARCEPAGGKAKRGAGQGCPAR